LVFTAAYFYLLSENGVILEIKNGIIVEIQNGVIVGNQNGVIVEIQNEITYRELLKITPQCRFKFMANFKQYHEIKCN